MAKMEARGRQSLIWTGVGIYMISCCIQCILGDVPDGFVYTDLLKTIPRGSTAVLKCEFYGPPLAVYWKKGDDPKQAPTLITLMDEKIWPGVCADENSCEMGDGYSLIIRDAQIEDQGRYICRVSNHLGILIHNFTDLNIFEPPREPYPVIKECNDSSSLQKDYGCDISTLKNVNLTCSASSFFPDLDLFFLHGTEKIATTESYEWTNDDGTRSKSVTINATPKDTPYVCVASDVPGNQKERAITVFVRLLHSDTSTASAWSTPIPPKEMNVVIIIVVPIVFVTIAGGCILIVCWRRHRRQDSKGRGQEEGRVQDEGLPLLEPMAIQGKVSFYEIWMMVSRVTMSDMGKLNNTLHKLGITKLVEGSTPQALEAYQHLCQWKTDNENTNQADILKKALETSRYGGAWKAIWDLRRNSAIRVSEGILEHILWHIGEPGKINEFLSELIPGRATTHFEDTDEMSKLVQKPLRKLKEWSKGTFDENPVALLSLALERAGCSSIDRTFFCVPDEPISSDELHHFVKKLASRHCDRLANVVHLTRDENKTIIDENNNDSFDAEAMISDWLAKGNNSHENSSHVESRCKLNHAAISIGRHDLKGYLVGYGNHLISSDTGQEEHTEHSEEAKSSRNKGNSNPGKNVGDAELRRIVQYLDQAELSEIFGEHAEGDSFTTIKAWIEKKGQPVSCRQSLRANLRHIGMQDLIPLEIEEDVCLVELVDIAFRLMMMDIYPLAEAIDVSADKLKSYKRQSLNKSKLSRGTMGVLVRLGEQTKYARSKLCDALAQGTGLQEIAHLLKYGYELSHGDLGAVATGDGSGKDQCAIISENLGIITEVTNTMDMLNLWRSLMKSPSYNPRTTLADAVFPVLGKEKALGIISGQIRRSGSQSGNVIVFIRDTITAFEASHIATILGVHQTSLERGNLTIKQVLEIWKESLNIKSLEDDQRGNLCKVLYNGGFKSFSSQLLHGEYLEKGDKEKTIRYDVACNVSEVLDVKIKPSEGMSHLKEVLENWAEKIRETTLNQQKRFLLSNRLFKEGYTDFSFEVMIGFAPKPVELEEEANLGQKSVIQHVKTALLNLPAVETFSTVL